MSPRYESPAAFHAAVEVRLGVAATTSGRPVNEVRRHYLTQRFLARVYARPNPDWVLLGGSALLARIPGARHSQDVDFVYSHDLTAAATALAELIAADPAPDPFTFDITASKPGDDNHLTLKITARLGATIIDTFPVDITRRPSFPTIDTVHVESVIAIDDVDELPPFLTIPLAHQVADKLCAMYETHGAARLPSSRFRDLVDLVIVITRPGGTELAANSVTSAVVAEQLRRGITIPPDLPPPGPQWATGYNRMALRQLPRTLNRLEPSLNMLRAFAGPILAGTAYGTWHPQSHRWRLTD